MTIDDDDGGGNATGGKLPIKQSDILRNMRAALPARRGGGDGVFIRVAHTTGAVTFGRDDTPLPMAHLYVVPWIEVKWGYKEFAGRTVAKTVLASVAAGPCPLPAGNFAPYGTDGARACMEVRLCSLNEPGFAAIYSCLNESGTSRIFDLWSEIAAQYEANADFANPVVSLRPDSYSNQYGTTFCLAYDVRDWMGDDGATLLSQAGPAPAPLGGSAEAATPF